MRRRPPRSTQSRSSAASDVYKRQVLEYQQHDHGTGDRFDPRRTGLDHIGFLVRSRVALDDWAASFVEQGVDHTPVVERDYGAVLTFRDLDGIQLEMFWREGHP